DHLAVGSGLLLVLRHAALAVVELRGVDRALAVAAAGKRLLDAYAPVHAAHAGVLVDDLVAVGEGLGRRPAKRVVSGVARAVGGRLIDSRRIGRRAHQLADVGLPTHAVVQRLALVPRPVGQALALDPLAPESVDHD